MADPPDRYVTCRCGRRLRLVEVQPSPLAPGAVAVAGTFCPKCDTANR